MDSGLSSFFGEAHSVTLTDDERRDTRVRLTAFMAAHPVMRAEGEEPQDLIAGLQSAATVVTLDADEKEAVRMRLTSFMQMRPATGVTTEEESDEAMPRGYAVLSALFQGRFMPVMSAAFVGVMVTGGALAYAAGGALPGDTLYPVKIHILESAFTHMRFAPAAQAAWEEELAVRRLQEAELLKAHGRLDDTVKSFIKERFASHASRAAQLRGSSDASIAAAQKHEMILRELAGEEGQKDVQFKVLLDRVQRATREVERSVASAGAAASEAPVDAVEAERQVQAAHYRVEQTRVYLVDAKDRIDAATMAAAQGRLNQAGNLLAQAGARLDAGSIDDAYTLAKKANLLAQEAKLMGRAEGEAGAAE